MPAFVRTAMDARACRCQGTSEERAAGLARAMARHLGPIMVSLRRDVEALGRTVDEYLLTPDELLQIGPHVSACDPFARHRFKLACFWKLGKALGFSDDAAEQLARVAYREVQP